MLFRSWFLQDEEYFKSAVFSAIIRYATAQPRKVRLKDTGGQPLIIIESVPGVSAALEVLKGMSVVVTP